MKELSCEEVRHDLVAYVDGELQAESATKIQGHLVGCGSCDAERAGLEEAWQALEALPSLEPRPGWLEELETSILDSHRTARPTVRLLSLSRSWGARVALAASLLVAGGLVWLLVRGPGEPTQAQLVTPKAPAPRVEAPSQPRPQSAPEALPAMSEDPSTSSEPAFAQLDALSNEELEVVENLDLLVMLDELEEQCVLDALEVLDDLDEGEFLGDET